VDVVADFLERCDQFREKRFVPADRQAFYILENEGARVQLRDETHEVQHETVAGIFQSAMPDQGKALAWRSAKNAIDLLPADAGSCAYIFTRDLRDRSRDNNRIREIELMDDTMHRVDFDSGDYIESGLLEAQA
jgi:hypothetical protein